MLKLVCIALLVASVSSGSVKYTDCGHSEITKLDSNECEGEICKIQKNKEFKLNAEFVANQSTNKTQVEITVVASGVLIPLPDVDTDGCKYVKCPLVKGQKNNFALSKTIDKLWPNIEDMDLSVKLSADNGTLACFTLKSSLVD